MRFSYPVLRPLRGVAGLLILGAALQAGAARAGSGTVGVEDVSFGIGFSKYTAKHLDLTDSSLSGADLKALLADIAKSGSADSISKLDAGSIVIPDLALDQNVAGMHQLAHYKNVKLTDIRAGKVGSYSIESGAIGGDMGNGQTMTGVLHRLGGTDIDLPALVRVFTQASADGNAPMQPLYGTAYADGYEIKSPQFTISVGKVTMSGISGRPLKTSLTEIFAKMPKPKKPGTQPAPEDEKAALAFFPAFLDLYAAFSIAKTEFHDLKVVTAGDPRRIPLACVGGRVSPGIVFLLTVMPTVSSSFSACRPLIPAGETSTSIKCVSVPPETIEKPARCISSESVFALSSTCCA